MNLIENIDEIPEEVREYEIWKAQEMEKLKHDKSISDDLYEYYLIMV